MAETGTAGQLHDRPLHPYTLRLIGSVPDIDGERERCRSAFRASRRP